MYQYQKINRTIDNFISSVLSSDKQNLVPKQGHESLAGIFLLALNSSLSKGGNPIEMVDGSCDFLELLPAINSIDRRVKVSEGSIYTYSNGYWRSHSQTQIRGYISGLQGVLTYGGPDKITNNGIISWKDRLKPIDLRDRDKSGIANICLEVEPIQDPTFLDPSSAASGGVCLKNGFLSISRRLPASPGVSAASPGVSAASPGVSAASKYSASLIPHHPNQRATYRLEHEWPSEDPGEPTEFLEHLEGCYKGDSDSAEKIAVIQEFIGLTITGFAHRISGAKCVLLQGVAQSGKSIIHEVVERLFPRRDSAGNMLVLSQSPDEWASPAGTNSADFKLMPMRHCVLNSCRELPDWKHLRRAESFKKIITGDPVSCRPPGGVGITFFPHAGHLFSNNHIGQVAPEGSEGFFRRFAIVEHNRSFKGVSAAKDKVEYIEYLTTPEALHRLMVWGVKGAIRVLNNGESYTELPSGEHALQSWRDAADPLGRFIEEACLVSSEHEQKFSFVWSEYKAWCELTEEDAGRRKDFELALIRRKFNVVVHDKLNQKMAKGITIRDSSNAGSNWRKLYDETAPSPRRLKAVR